MPIIWFEKNEDYAIWSCLNGKTGEKYLAFFNFREEAQRISCSPEAVEQFAGRTAGIRKATELWSGTDRKLAEGVLRDSVSAHGAGLFVLL